LKKIHSETRARIFGDPVLDWPICRGQSLAVMPPTSQRCEKCVSYIGTMNLEKSVVPTVPAKRHYIGWFFVRFGKLLRRDAVGLCAGPITGGISCAPESFI
jgi:hypothetical protein